MLKGYIMYYLLGITVIGIGIASGFQHKQVNQHIDASAINMAYYYCEDNEGLNHIISEGDKGIAVTCNNGVNLTIEKDMK